MVMKKTYLFGLIFSVLACGLLYTSCTKDKAVIKPVLTTADTVSYKNEILPLMQNNCSTSGCHDATTAQNGFVFVDYATITQNAGPALEAMKGINNRTQMPLSGPLDAKLIDAFDIWIAQGMLNN